MTLSLTRTHHVSGEIAPGGGSTRHETGVGVHGKRGVRWETAGSGAQRGPQRRNRESRRVRSTGPGYREERRTSESPGDAGNGSNGNRDPSWGHCPRDDLFTRPDTGRDGTYRPVRRTGNCITRVKTTPGRNLTERALSTGVFHHCKRRLSLLLTVSDGVNER